VVVEIKIQILKIMMTTTLSIKITISTEKEISTKAEEEGILTKRRCNVTTVTNLAIILMSVSRTTIQTREVRRMMRHT